MRQLYMINFSLSEADANITYGNHESGRIRYNMRYNTL